MDYLYRLLDDLSISERSGILLMSPKNEFLFSTNEGLSGCSSLLNKNTVMIDYEDNTYDISSLTDNRCGFTFYYLSSRKDIYKSYSTQYFTLFSFMYA
jgi:hypothetical protein